MKSAAAAKKARTYDGHPEWVSPEAGQSYGFTLVSPEEEGKTGAKVVILDCSACGRLTRHSELDQNDPKTPKPRREGYKLVWARAICLKCNTVYSETYTPKLVNLYCPNCDPAGERKMKHFKVEPDYPQPPRTERNNYILLEPNAVCTQCGSVDYNFTQLKTPDENVVSLTDQLDAATVRKI